MLRCKTCGGVYPDKQRDGTLYFHACPPSWDGTAKQYVERTDKRDENVKVIRDAAGVIERIDIQSAGKGSELAP